jgi:predicted acyltransferase
VFRGLTMAAMVIVNNPGDDTQTYAPLQHAAWNGWTPTDLIFPFFVFIVGVSVTLSRRSREARHIIVRRAAVIYALGFALALYPRFDLSIVRVMGVLPRLAICYLCAALVYRAIVHRDDTARLQVTLGVAAGLIIAYWAVLRFVPAPGGVAGDLTPSGNIGAWIDRHVIGEAHLWRVSKTWDPEGLLSTLPAIATALTGVAAGVFIRSDRPAAEKVAMLIAAGGVCMAAGLAWDQRFPINKNLWTSSYVLFTSGLAAIVLAILHWMIDVRERHVWIRPFVVLGTNALALFVVSGWLVKTLLWVKLRGPAGAPTSLYHWIYVHGFEPFASPRNASLLFALANLAVLYLLLEWLYRRKWFLRV